jgi:hypothetical protein
LTSAGLLAAGVSSKAAKAGICDACHTGHTCDKPATVQDVRMAARHFAMLYFHVCKTWVEAVGEEAAFPLVRKVIFELSLDRSDQIRAKALAQGLEPATGNFAAVNDLPVIGWDGWDPASGGDRCPYAEAWLKYMDEYPWFKRFASMYCDVIDTTNVENYTRTTSHRITRNVLWGDAACEREFFESEQVKQGVFTYGKRS